MRVTIAFFCLFFMSLSTGVAIELKVEKLAANVLPSNIFAETAQPSTGGLPDGLITVSESGSDIASAWYGSPTKRYAHGILGDAVEAGSLTIKLPDNKEKSIVLPQSSVFEDRYPRLVDLDGDGNAEVITIKASLRAGASVAIYGLEDEELVEKATTGYHGRANRWLNIAGIDDYLGTGQKQIAFVRTPHIGGTLFFYSYDKGKLNAEGEIYGFSNHFIGSPEMRLSATLDLNGDGILDIAVPSNDRKTLRLISVAKSGPVEIGSVRFDHRIDKAILLEKDGSSMIVGTEDGSIYRLKK